MTNARGRVSEPPPIDAHEIFVPGLLRPGQRIDNATWEKGQELIPEAALGASHAAGPVLRDLFRDERGWKDVYPPTPLGRVILIFTRC